MMNAQKPRSKTALFLMEMILSLLILSIAAAACVQVFAAARSLRRQAREWNHMQELTICVGEILEGSAGTAEDFQRLLGEGTEEGNTLRYFFDGSWQPCQDTEDAPAAYRMELTLTSQEGEKQAEAVFYNHRDEILHRQTFRFPLPVSWKEGE